MTEECRLPTFTDREAEFLISLFRESVEAGGLQQTQLALPDPPEGMSPLSERLHLALQYYRGQIYPAPE